MPKGYGLPNVDVINENMSTPYDFGWHLWESRP